MSKTDFTGKRTVITEGRLKRMFPPSIDKLFPEGTESLAEHKGRRKRWVGIGWVDEGEADGTEYLVIEKDKTWLV